jgi:hypothetical protein
LEILSVNVNTFKSHDLPWEEVQVAPVGDLQLGSEGSDEVKFRQHILWCIEHKVRLLGMGDYIDLMSPSNRTAFRAMRKYEVVQSAMDEAAQRLIDRFLHLVRGTEGLWLGLLEGHHFHEFEDGTTSDTRICQALGAPFLGTSALVSLHFQNEAAHVGEKCVIWCHHGANGGGRSLTYSVNKLNRDVVPYWDADIYLMGHLPIKPAVPIKKAYLTAQDRLVWRKKIIAGTGGFCNSYVLGNRSPAGNPRGDYAEQGMMPPAVSGGIILKIRPARDADGNPRIDLNVEI